MFKNILKIISFFKSANINKDASINNSGNVPPNLDKKENEDSLDVVNEPIKANQDEYLVYTSPTHDTFYFKNRKLHRESGPAIVCRKDKNKGNFVGLHDQVLYKRVFDPVEHEQNDPILFEAFHCDSSYYLEGIRYKTENELHIARTEKAKNELAEELSTNETIKIPKKLKI